MKIKLKTLADKITAVALYLICMTIVISLFLEVSYMADYGFYDKFQLTESTTTRLMKEKVDKEYSNIEEYVLLSFKNQIKKLQSSDSDYELYRSLCEKYNKRDNTNLIISARTNNGMYKLNNLQNGELNEGELLSDVVGNSPDKKIQTCFGTSRTTSFFDENSATIRPVTIHIYIRSDLSADDTFRLTSILIRTANNLKYFIIIAMFIALITGMATVAVLMVNVNYTPGHMRFIDKIPFDLFSILTVAMNGFVISMIVLMSADKIREDDIVLWNASCAILAFVVFCIMLIYFLSLAVRIKAGHVFRNTLIYKIIERIRKGNSDGEKSGYFKMPFVGKLIITVGFVLALDLGLIIFNYFRFKSKGLAYNFPVFALIQVTMALVVGMMLS